MSAVIVCDLAEMRHELRRVFEVDERCSGIVVAVSPVPMSGAMKGALRAVEQSRRWTLDKPVLLDCDGELMNDDAYRATHMVLQAARWTREMCFIFLVDDSYAARRAIRAFAKTYPNRTVHVCTSSDEVLRCLPDTPDITAPVTAVS